jgi:hypothetical protein
MAGEFYHAQDHARGAGVTRIAPALRRRDVIISRNSNSSSK